MPEFTIPEVANPARCLDIFCDSLDDIINRLPLSESERPKTTYTINDDDDSNGINNCFLDFNLEISEAAFVNFSNTSFRDSLRRLTYELNSSLIVNESISREDGVVYINYYIEFSQLECSALIKAGDFEDDFYSYINRKYYSPQLTVLEINRSEVKITDSRNGGYIVTGQVALNADMELNNIKLFRDLESEKDAIIKDLDQIARKYGTSLTDIDRSQTIICFEVVFQ
jgi:hypothetical protein